ncbi:MAG TPA: hypothetical protein VF771_08675, partial [Longimicrobiaceae bacterium]
MREAEFWLRRSHRIAVWTGDAYAQTIALSSLGVLAYLSGNQGRAERRLGKALTVAVRNGLRVLEGEVLHNLMGIEIERHEYARAEEYAVRVMERYLPGHERLPALAHDIATLWMDQGHFARALPVIRSIIPRFVEADLRFQAYAAMVRAAGGAGEVEAYEWAAAGAYDCAAKLKQTQVLAAALLD